MKKRIGNFKRISIENDLLRSYTIDDNVMNSIYFSFLFRTKYNIDPNNTDYSPININNIQTEVEYFTNLFKSTEYNIIPINLLIRYTSGDGHMNLLIFRKNECCLEHYEPMGTVDNDDVNVSKLLEKFCNKVRLSLPDLKFKSSANIHGYNDDVVFNGLQCYSNVNHNDQYCQYFCYLLTDFIFCYPSVPTEIIINFLFGVPSFPDKKTLRNIIPSLSKQIKETITGFCLLSFTEILSLNQIQNIFLSKNDLYNDNKIREFLELNNIRLSILKE